MTGAAAVNALREGFQGAVMEAGEAGYDDACKMFNSMMDREPAVIARCASTDDVVAAVNFGRENGLEVAVRCGVPTWSTTFGRIQRK